MLTLRMLTVCGMLTVHGVAALQLPSLKAWLDVGREERLKAPYSPQMQQEVRPVRPLAAPAQHPRVVQLRC